MGFLNDRTSIGSESRGFNKVYAKELVDGMTATTQPLTDYSNKIATDKFVVDYVAREGTALDDSLKDYVDDKIDALSADTEDDLTAHDTSSSAHQDMREAIAGKANSSHGNHVPTTETANNARFLRNDNTWQTIEPGNINAYTKEEVNNIANSKAPTANPTFTGTVTAQNISVTGSLYLNGYRLYIA